MSPLAQLRTDIATAESIHVALCHRLAEAAGRADAGPVPEARGSVQP